MGTRASLGRLGSTKGLGGCYSLQNHGTSTQRHCIGRDRGRRDHGRSDRRGWQSGRPGSRRHPGHGLGRSDRVCRAVVCVLACVLETDRTVLRPRRELDLSSGHGFRARRFSTHRCAPTPSLDFWFSSGRHAWGAFCFDESELQAPILVSTISSRVHHAFSSPGRFKGSGWAWR